jgi:hypothetical protein
MITTQRVESPELGFPISAVRDIQWQHPRHPALVHRLSLPWSSAD